MVVAIAVSAGEAVDSSGRTAFSARKDRLAPTVRSDRVVRLGHPDHLAPGAAAAAGTDNIAGAAAGECSARVNCGSCS